ncbi:Pentatricopeptide repeat-containing protein At4g26680, mitochondrial [Linum perenne]
MVMSALRKSGRLDKAVELFAEMENGGVGPNVASYNVLIAGYCKKGLLSSSMKLKSSMERKKNNGLQQNVVTFNTLIHELCKEGKTKKAAYLVKELDKEKMVPNASTFSALIGGQCARNNPDRASQLYKTMVRSGCHPNKQTFDVLIAAFCKNKDFEGACRVLLEMLNKCITPTSDFIVDTYNGLSQCGMNHLAMKLQSEIKASIYIYFSWDIKSYDFTIRFYDSDFTQVFDFTWNHDFNYIGST